MSLKLRNQALRASKRSLMGLAGCNPRIYLPSWATTLNLCRTFPTSSSSFSSSSLWPFCLNQMSSWSSLLTLMAQGSILMLGSSLRKRGAWLISSACYYIMRQRGHWWLMRSAMRLRSCSQCWWGRAFRKRKIENHLQSFKESSK